MKIQNIDKVSYGRILSFESKNQIFLFLWNILAKLCNEQNVFITLDKETLVVSRLYIYQLTKQVSETWLFVLQLSCAKLYEGCIKSCVKIEQHENEMEYEINIDEC